ncbi:sensor histidine kinase [Nocardioides bruguierae]|uniref:Sensor histidine kinase n=1 Tax=Nocardioides bruguierae TaxID=2945102 RepID=A0A9X2IFJ9_9ACTN|nr:sensor histidine kinase [Nocardioides bruguierae]MCM0621921.1 sensor histidine kinase [Nocardioides bruguierae]
MTARPFPAARLLWLVWLVFLAFPLSEAVAAGGAATALGVLGTLGFAAAYVVGVWQLPGGAGSRTSLVVLALLAGLVLGLVPVIGLGVVSFLPFLQSYGVFVLPRPWCFWWVGVVALGLLAPWLLDPSQGWLVVTLIVVAVGAGTAVGRELTDRGDALRGVSEQLAVTAERERVARDVHDVLGHSLTVVVLKAELAERLVEADPAAARRELGELRDLAREALAEVRATVTGLRAAVLTDELAAARSALEAAGVAARMPDDGGALDPALHPAAAWAVREAVTNVVRHAHATACRVELLPAGVRVLDDGVGLRGSAPGNGLRGLRERVAAVDGLLEVADRPGGGTVLEVLW